MKKTILLFMIVLLLLATPLQVLATEYSEDVYDYTYEEENIEDYKVETYQGRVLRLKEEFVDDDEFSQQDFKEKVQIVTIEILNGPFKGEEHTIENIIFGNDAYDIIVKEGDKVFLYTELTEDGNNLIDIHISDFLRYPQLRNIALLFIVLVILVGKWQGVKSIIALGITAFAIIQFMLPMMLNGHNPILLAILVCMFSAIFTIVLIGGFSIKTLSTIIGTLSGVLIAGLLSYVVGNAIHLTGLSAQESQMLMFIPQGTEFDFRGLLFAGIIIGALGAVMDVAMSISSAMEEIKGVNDKIDTKELVKSGFSVGKDVMGTMSNTLILAYTGSAIPLLLLFMAYESSIVNIVNIDLIATEIVRALAGSIGLIISIPVTALAYGLLSKKKRQRKE